mmetsp:Transcript_126772/g.289999  ORF Transcript_126772/g.289999 Transcript_126772/m.289999 type:complete len:123 (+) Transcript_126772:446-814(+)
MILVVLILVVQCPPAPSERQSTRLTTARLARASLTWAQPRTRLNRKDDVPAAMTPMSAAMVPMIRRCLMKRKWGQIRLPVNDGPRLVAANLLRFCGDDDRITRGLHIYVREALDLAEAPDMD